MNNILSPDFNNILRHITEIIGNAPDGFIEIVNTPPNSSACNSAKLFKVSEKNEAATYAFELNKNDGVNVYIGAALRHPNTAPFGRTSIEDFYLSNFAWVDLDQEHAATSAREKYKDLPPSFVVVTGRHPNLRAQCWWRLSAPEYRPDALKSTLAHLCGYLDGDKAVVDAPRIMRLAGSIAWPKKEGRVPELTEFIIPASATAQTTLGDINNHFPLVTFSPDTQQATSGGVGLFSSSKSKLFHDNKEWSVQDIEGLLEFIHPDNEYIGWVKVGMALKDYGVSFDVWDRWSQTGSKYNSREMRKKWDSFRGTGTTIGSLVYQAKEGGWRPRNSGTNSSNNFYLPEFVNEETGEIIKAPKKDKMHLISASDFYFNPDANDIVRDIFTAGGLSVVYGESNCGKTFFITDLCFSISENKAWRGKRVEGGAAVYVPLEGVKGISSRIYAYKKENDTHLKDFYVMPTNFNFLDEGQDTEEFINLLKNSQVQGVKIVVIDTLARAVGGGDENSGQDMGLLVRHADRIRAHTGAHVCFVHHSGKDKAKGARGHSSLRAAVDTEIEISREEGQNSSTIKIVKQRDMEMIEPMAFKLKRVVLGQNKYGEDVSSCVVEHEDYKETTQVRRLTPIQEFIYSCIVSALIDRGVYLSPHKDMPLVKCITYDDLHESLYARGFKEFLETEKKTTATQVKNATTNARISLQKMNKISFYGNYIWLLNQED